MSDAIQSGGGRSIDPLRLVRHERAEFEPRFFERHPDFWPIARAASVFADRADWPEVVDYAKTFDGAGPVTFELSPPKRRRPNGEPVDRAALYDAVIVHRRVVPTRARMWHDYLNALVWATFPASKLAIHRRQHLAIERWIPDGATQLPNARTRELDALALVDEGGVIVLDFGTSEHRIVFGHALYEGLVFERPAMLSRRVVFDVRGHASSERAAALRLADEKLSTALADTGSFLSPEELDQRRF